MTARSKYWSPESVVQRNERRNRVDAHFNAGTCYICEQPVLDGVALHGPTGAHWECHQGPIEQQPVSVPKRALEQFAPKPDTVPRLARANGGSLVHFVIPATGVSLCGHKPKHTAHHMKRRGKWLGWKDDAVPGHLKQCTKCLANASKLYPPAD